MSFNKVMVAGSGVLGYQIAFHIAYHGYKVIVYDISDEILLKAKTKFNILAEAYKKDLNATDENLNQTALNISYTSDISIAVQDADLAIEAVPESIKTKMAFYEQLAKVAPSETIFATNSSTLLPSEFAEITKRPKQFLAFHFANEIWIHNTAEIMGHAETDPAVFEKVVNFAKQIGMVALPVYKEQRGYILNSLLIPILDAATNLWINEVSDPEIIDKTWMVATGSPLGPFGILDLVGITTVFNINRMTALATKDPTKIKIVEKLKTDFIDQNKLGQSSGEGFYKYPNPKYLDKDFLL